MRMPDISREREPSNYIIGPVRPGHFGHIACEALVDAALPAHACKDLGLKPDDKVFIRLRNTRFFDEDFSI